MALPPVRSIGNSSHVADHNDIVAEVKLRTGFNVKDYGAIGNDSTNDATAIQSAITAAQTAGGGVVYFPPGGYAISSTLNITDSNVMLAGAGGDTLHDNGSINANAASWLRWTGSAGGTMVKFASPTGGTEQTRTGGGVRDLVFHSNYSIGSVAGIGLNVNSWRSGDFRRLYFFEFDTAAILVDCTAGGGEARDTQGCTFHGIQGRQRQATGTFLKLDGNGTANASLNIFEHMDVSFQGLTNVGAYALYDCDNNVFTRCRANTSAAGDAVVFHAKATGWAGDNTFVAFSSSNIGNIKMKGTEEAANPSSNNTMLLLDSGNGALTPTLGTGATGWWTFTNGTGRARNVQMVVGGNTGNADYGLANMAGTTSLNVVNTAADHIRLDDGTNRWGINIASNNLRLGVLAGTGIIDLGSDTRFVNKAGFNNTTPIAKPTVTGSRGANAALASLLTALANYGLIVDSSS